MSRINEIVTDLKYQYPTHPSTFGPCSNEHCGGSARGSRVCAGCLEDELSELTDSATAARIRRMIRNLAYFEIEAYELDSRKAN